MASIPNSPDVERIDINGAKASLVLQWIRKFQLDPEYNCNHWNVDEIYEINKNKTLRVAYEQRKAQLGPNSRETLAFACAGKDKVVSIARDGVVIESNRHVVGDTNQGINLCCYSDVQLKAAAHCNNMGVFLFVFKVAYCKQKKVEAKEGNAIQPDPDFDCHVSLNQPTSGGPIGDQLRKSQIYLYEHGENGAPVRRPRQVFPLVVIHFLSAAEVTSSSQVVQNCMLVNASGGANSNQAIVQFPSKMPLTIPLVPSPQSNMNTGLSSISFHSLLPTGSNPQSPALVNRNQQVPLLREMLKVSSSSGNSLILNVGAPVVSQAISGAFLSQTSHSGIIPSIPGSLPVIPGVPPCQVRPVATPLQMMNASTGQIFNSNNETFSNDQQLKEGLSKKREDLNQLISKIVSEVMSGRLNMNNISSLLASDDPAVPENRNDTPQLDSATETVNEEPYKSSYLQPELSTGLNCDGTISSKEKECPKKITLGDDEPPNNTSSGINVDNQVEVTEENSAGNDLTIPTGNRCQSELVVLSAKKTARARKNPAHDLKASEAFRESELEVPPLSSLAQVVANLNITRAPQCPVHDPESSEPIQETEIEGTPSSPLPELVVTSPKNPVHDPQASESIVEMESEVPSSDLAQGSCSRAAMSPINDPETSEQPQESEQCADDYDETQVFRVKAHERQSHVQLKDEPGVIVSPKKERKRLVTLLEENARSEDEFLDETQKKTPFKRKRKHVIDSSNHSPEKKVVVTEAAQAGISSRRVSAEVENRKEAKTQKGASVKKDISLSSGNEANEKGREKQNLKKESENSSYYNNKQQELTAKYFITPKKKLILRPGAVIPLTKKSSASTEQLSNTAPNVAKTPKKVPVNYAILQ